MARIDEHVVGQLEQTANRAEELPRARLGFSACVEIRTADVADEEGIAREDEPRIFGSPPPIGDDVGVVCGGMPGGGKRPNERVSELDHLTVGERRVLEVDVGADGEVRGRPCRLDERGKPGDVVGLHVRLEDGRDGRARALRRLQIAVDELHVRIDDRERGAGEAAEQVARAGRLLVEEGTEDHCLSQR
jgi:hypothetical protein